METLETQLTVADMIFDAVYYKTKLKPTKHMSKFPLGSAVRPSHLHKRIGKLPPVKFKRVPNSILNAITTFCATDTNKCDLPLLRPTPTKLNVARSAWASALTSGTLSVSSDVQGIIPLSTATHENGQLMYGRHHNGVPLKICESENECAAHDVVDSQGPLHIYLTISEEDEYNQTGTIPLYAAHCLLCIRRDAHALEFLRQSLPPLKGHTGRGTTLLPPFYNLVDCPDGYKKESFPSAEGLFGSVRIVGECRNLRAVYNPFTKQWGINQEHILHGSPKNGRAVV